MQIARRQREIIGKSAGMPVNSDRRPVAALARYTALAEITRAVGDVDLADDSLTHPFRRALDHFGDELVPRNAGKVHVAVDQLKVGAANPGAANFQQCLIRHGFWGWRIRLETQAGAEAVVKEKRAHSELGFAFDVSSCAARRRFTKGISPFSHDTSSGTAMKIDE